MNSNLEISVESLKTQLSKDTLVLIDVRTHEEFAQGHLPCIHIPLHDLPHQLSELKQDVNYAVVCRSGVRSLQATQLLDKAGFSAVNVTGGFKAWKAQIDPQFVVA